MSTLDHSPYGQTETGAAYTEAAARAGAVARDLQEAAGYIEEHGWCQGDLVDLEGRVCPVGAIRATTGHVAEFVAAVSALRRHLKVEFLTVWNDTPGRTQDEVVTALRAAAGAIS